MIRDLLILACGWMRRLLSVPHALTFRFGIILKNPRLVPCYHSIQKFWIDFIAVMKFLAHKLPVPFSRKLSSMRWTIVFSLHLSEHLMTCTEFSICDVDQSSDWSESLMNSWHPRNLLCHMKFWLFSSPRHGRLPEVSRVSPTRFYAFSHKIWLHKAAHLQRGYRKYIPLRRAYRYQPQKMFPGTFRVDPVYRYLLPTFVQVSISGMVSNSLLASVFQWSTNSSSDFTFKHVNRISLYS